MTALYSLYDALLSINVPADKARAVVDAMERDMTALLATKSDIALLRQDIESSRALAAKDIQRLAERMDQKLELQRSSMIIWLGSMQAVGIGILYTLQKLSH